MFYAKNALDKTKPPEANGGLGAELQRFGNFTTFFQKIHIFRHILV